MLQIKWRIALDRVHRSSNFAAILLDPILAFSGVKQMRSSIWINLGLQSFRMRTAEILFKISKIRRNSKVCSDTRKRIDENGLIAFENYLDKKSHQKLKEEISQLKRTVKPDLDQWESSSGNYRVWKLKIIDDRRFPELRKLITDNAHRDILAYIQGFMPPKWQYDPVLQETSWNMDMQVDDPNCHFHSDYFTHTAKGFYFIEAVTIDGAPFEYVVGSHVFNRQRIAREAHAFKNGSNESLRIDVKNQDVTVMTVPGNTLMFADTAGLHRRRPPESEKSRTIIYFNGGGQKPTYLRRLLG